MIDYKPATKTAISLGQTTMVSSPPPPVIDTVFAGYEGAPGVLASVAFLAITGSAAYLGVQTGLKAESKTLKTLGWIGGIGSALLALLYLGQKSGLTIGTQAPAVNIYPS